jgi:aspartyl-tRNA(Asn)/glutamyl-tRNA(Gln) amidotransferase subunit B
MNPEFETVIGLEVHAQLTTRSKMFCRCGSDYASAEPNTRTCPVCLGMPGVLPTINRQAVENTILTALALNCQVPERAKFDRKNYPYPDLVKGYQISQYDEPFGLGGWIEVETDGNSRRLGITRVHLEEDVCKLLHRGTGSNGYSLVDANRSGVPLMEIVSEPDMRSPAEARNYLIKLRSILRYLGVSLANMEEGSFRCDANISIRPKGSEELLAKVEVKNMNSLKAVYRALEFEAERQRKAFINGEKINQETRGWVEETGKTVSQRSKEYAHDYRYFPEPDLPPLEVSREWVENIRCRMPELPDQRCQRFIKDYSLSDYDAGILTASKEAADYFETVLSESGRSPKEVANWIAGPVSGIINAQGIDFEDFGKKVSPEEMTGLLKLEGSGSINMATAKTVLEEMFNTGKSAATLVNEKGLTQISGSEELDQFAVQVIEANPSAVADFKAGKEQALKFLIGQMMRLPRGRANPEIAADILKRKLEEY